MRLTAGRGRYHIDGVGQFLRFVAKSGLHAGKVLLRVGTMNEEVTGNPGRGIPAYVTVIGTTGDFMVWPIPDADYDLEVSYFPKMKVV